MEICRYRREEIDHYKIYAEYNGKYPDYNFADKGSSFCYGISPEWFFKRKQQDGNYGIHNPSNSLHHFVYDESYGSLDDLAEVFCYNMSKKLGEVEKVDINGNTFITPNVDVAEYRLASFTNINGEEERGCISRNIISNGEELISGRTILRHLNSQINSNSIENHILALQKYSQSKGIILDPNIVRDLVVNSYFCWKTANTDNHSNNINYIKTFSSNGTPYLKVSKMIDNGAAWECSSPYSMDTEGSCRYKAIFENMAGKKISEEEAKLISFTREPFNNHVAFKINNIIPMIGLKNMSEYDSYLYGVSSYAFSNPEIYSSILQIEKNFDYLSVANEMKEDLKINFPPYFLDMVKATSDYKTNVFSRVMGDYFCRVAYSSCISSEINEDDEMYKVFQEHFSDMPLQESAEGYMKEFATFAKENGIEINEVDLKKLEFLPNQNDEEENSEFSNEEDSQ